VEIKKWDEELYMYIISPHVQNSSSYSNIKSMAKVNAVARFPAEYEQFGFRHWVSSCSTLETIVWENIDP